MKLTRRKACGLLAGSRLLAAPAPTARRTVGLRTNANEILLQTGDAVCRFTRTSSGWGFESASVRGKKTALPLSREDGFISGGGEAQEFSVAVNTPARKEIRFTGRNFSARWVVDAADHLPRFFIEIIGPQTPTCAWRTAEAAANQRGAWVTRGETASDAESREVFIDGSGRFVFGHSMAGSVDAAYVIQVELLDNVNRRNKTMQVSDTFLKSARQQDAAGAYFGTWQIRFGAAQPKRFGIVFDRDLGGRMHDVCEKYYADAVDSQIEVSAIPVGFDPYLAVERMPLRLSCPESLIPGYGWHMEEYFPGYGKAAYPFGDDSGIQTAALLAYGGLATGRAWEKNFGKYVMDQMPIWGDADGKAWFTKRPEGWTRWAYHYDYSHPFPYMEGGNWSVAEQIYWVAKMFGDRAMKESALGLFRHDIHVKLDLEQMTFPPCFDPVNNKLIDHRDDWNTTACLGYCAEICSEVLYPETKDPQYLKIADRITDWLQSIWGPETRMNYLHPKVNTFHCWMGWLMRAMVHRYERSERREFLETAQDLSWVIVLTLCTTAHKDMRGQSLTGVTCVGVRGCVDYDCAPNLCQEKDQAFLQIMGPLFSHVGGPGYAKYIALQKSVLPRDSWVAAFRVQEQRDLNLRTSYDNFARGMTNLAFALNRSSDPEVCVLEKLVSNFDTEIDRRRDIVVANGTTVDRHSKVQVRFLKPGRYTISMDGRAIGTKSADELDSGFDVSVPRNSTRSLQVRAASIDEPRVMKRRYDGSELFLSDLNEWASQREIGLPQPAFQKDLSFRGGSLKIGDRQYLKGLGLAANTVIVYKLNGRYESFRAVYGIASDAKGPDGPQPSANLTIFADGECRLTSVASTVPEPVSIDVRGAETMVVRVSSNWDDNGDYRNDMVNLCDARLVGKSV